MKTDKGQNFYALEYNDTEWMTQNGLVLEIKDMDKMHVFNSVRLLQRRNKILEQSGEELYKIPRLLIASYEKFEDEMPEYFV